MNTLYNKIYIILLIIILSGCDKSPPQPDTWEKMMTNTMGVPQNSWRLHTSMRGRIRIIYIFQTDQQWTDCIHLQALKLQDGLDARVSYSGISTDNILDVSGVKNDFNKEIIKNPEIYSLINKDFLKGDLTPNSMLHIRDKFLEKEYKETDKHEFITFPFGEIFILYKKIIQGDKYLVIIAISPHEK